MAVSTDPLQRESIGVVARDTGARLVAPATNSALQLASALREVQPALTETLDAVEQKRQTDAETEARQAAIQTSGKELADAVRLGQIKPSQNPWFVDAYNRESAAIRTTDQLSKLQLDSQQWAERNDPVAFATKWHQEVSNIAQGFTDPDSMKGFQAAEAQATQQTLATNQAYNSQRIEDGRTQTVTMLASDALQRAVQANGGVISGSKAALALAPSKANFIATGGSLDQWNKIAISAISAASYSIRSPHLIDLAYDPALVQGPRENDTTSYGDTPQPTPANPDPLAPLPVVAAPQDPQAAGPAQRLAMPVVGRITNTFAQHEARGSAGVDIAVPVGSKITTPIGGTAHVGFQKGKAGLFVKIVSPDGKTEQVLAHLSLASVQDGQQVGPGTIIGRSGQSGDATGPHVHWQLKVGGQQVDPLSYQVAQAADASHEQATQVAEGEALPALAAAPASQNAAGTAVQTVSTPQHPEGPALADIPGVAEQLETERYRIQEAVRSEAGDKLQAIVNQRKLDSLAATDRLYATFGTKLLSGDVEGPTIIRTLSNAGYSPQVIAGAVDNVQNAVSTSASLSTARLSLNAANPAQAKAIFDLHTEGVTSGYSPEYERRVGNAVLNGDISATEGASMVDQAVSRTKSDQSEARAEQRFQEQQAEIGTPGTIIRKAGDLKRGIDELTSRASINAARAAQAGGPVRGSVLSTGTQKIIKQHVTNIVEGYLADHPNDWAGAEQAGRDYVAAFLHDLMTRHGTTTTPAPRTSAAGGNPRR